MEVNEEIRRVGGSRSAFIAVIVLTVTCAVLLVVNHQLQKQNSLLIERYQAFSIAEGPTVGSRISFLHGTSVSGQNITLDLAQRDKGTLLLVLSPTCPHCKANFPNWRGLLPMLSTSQVVWVDVAGTAEASYLTSAAIPADAQLIRLNIGDRSLYKMNATPTTIWLSPHGVVKQVWIGELREDQVKQIREALVSPNA